MRLYEIADQQVAEEDEELKALAARIVPLPKGILPATRFMKQTRKLLLSLNDPPATKAA